MSPEEFETKTFDYIICGGGTAGLVIAARLSEDPNVTVGVVEAGGNRLGDALIDAPNLFTQLWGKPEYDWDYQTVPQRGTDGKKHAWVRGKVLGGSSAVNFNMLSMASRQDLDNWVELGNRGWGFDDMMQYFRKFETYHPPDANLAAKLSGEYIDASLRGTSGPVQTCFPPNVEVTWAQDAWPKTIINAGYKSPKDPRTGSSIGGFNQLVTVDPKLNRRSYSARAYYEPNAGRPNLSLLTHALVSRIVLEKTGGEAKATGIEFCSNGKSYSAKANKEVIVSGGTINSPQLLELSGIGSSAVLQKAGVDVVVDNPNVGENLNDHSVTGVCLSVKDEYPTAEAFAQHPQLARQAMEVYTKFRIGPFAGPPTTTGFASLEMVDPDLDAGKHVQTIIDEYAKLHPDADPAGRNALLARQLLDPKEAVCQIMMLPTGANFANSHTPDQFLPSKEAGMWCTLGACSTRSLSRGSTHIASPDPRTSPVIDPAYFSHPLDVDMAARSVLHVLSLAEVEPLKSILRRDENGSPVPTKDSGGSLPKTLEEAKAFVARNSSSEYHGNGSCAMLPREKGGVVDDQLKVYGTSNIRVVDASIFPLIVQGNIVSMVYAVAEKAADLIKRQVSVDN